MAKKEPIKSEDILDAVAEEEMAENQQSLQYHHQQSWDEVKKALSDLMDNKLLLLKKDFPGFAPMYAHIESLYNRAQQVKRKDVLEIIDEETIRFLSLFLCYTFLLQPELPERSEALAVHLMMISAATDNFVVKKNFEPYNWVELEEIIQGEDRFYDDIYFVNTLRSIITGKDNLEHSKVLLKSLSTKSEQEDDRGLYFWDEAFVFSMILQAIWKNFAFFEKQKQIFLLQNYFYTAIVAGVPAQKLIIQALDKADEAKDESVIKLNNNFIKAIAGSHETVPIDTISEGGKRLSDIVSECFTKVYSGKGVDILAQENYIKEIYKGQQHADIFSFWIREVLNIILHMRKKNL